MPADTLAARVAFNLTAHRERNGLSKADVAVKIGVDERTIRRLENGRQSGAAGKLVDALAVGLGIPLGLLLKAKPAPRKGGKNGSMPGRAVRRVAKR